MGLMSFMKEAGEKLFGRGEAKAAAPAAATPEEIAARNKTAGDAIATYIRAQGLKVEGLQVGFDGASTTVTVAGTVADQATKEKVLLCCGNVAGVSAVTDQIVVDKPEPEAQWHTVVSGDNLSKIAKKFYGDANRWKDILEANKDSVKDPNAIRVGLELVIPGA